MKNLFKLHPILSHLIPQNPTIISSLLYIYIIRYHHPSDIKAHHLAQRINDREIKNYAQLHFFLKEGELLQSELKNDDDNFYYRMWNMADANHF